MMKRLLFVLTACAAFSMQCIFADYNRFNVPDSAQIRRLLVDTWFTEPIELIRGRNPEIHTNEAGERFQVRCEEHDNDFSIFVSPEAHIPLDIYSDSKITTITKTEYPGDISGSWVLVRNKSDGKPVRIRYYFAADSDVYVQVTPSGKITLADMVIFSNYPARGVQLGLSFEDFYTASFQQLFSWTQSVLPWNYVTVHTDMYHSNLQMIQVIRENLPDIVYSDDAMYNEAGLPVYVSTGKERRIR